MKLRLQTCCGCCDLHTGTLIVGICGVVFSAGGIITHTTGLENIHDETARQEIKVGIGYSYLFIIINALLIYGTIKESRYFLLPWLIYVAIGLGVATGLFIIAMFFQIIFALLVILCAGVWYVWICVLSYYHQLNPTNIPPMAVYASIGEVTTMAPTIVTYLPQPPEYTEIGRGPQVV